MLMHVCANLVRRSFAVSQFGSSHHTPVSNHLPKGTSSIQLYDQIMPRHSARQQAIMSARHRLRLITALAILERQRARKLTCMLLDKDMANPANRRARIFQIALVWSCISLMSIESNRYLFRNRYRDTSLAISRFEADLDDGTRQDANGVVPWLNETEFLRKYRMTRDAFWKLHDLICGHEVFQEINSTGRKQRPVRYQLALTLKAFGSEGSGLSGPNLRDVFATGKGSCIVYIRRVVAAIRSLRSHYINWPDATERKAIAKRIFKECGLPNCVGIVDGTLLGLAARPKREDAPDYKGRKMEYTLSGIFVNDDQRFIR